MLSPLLMWHKIGRIVLILARRLEITPLRALDVFYSSKSNCILSVMSMWPMKSVWNFEENTRGDDR